MPQVKANDININYDQQGSGEPLILLPFLTADNSCYAFQVAEYAKHFTCFSVDLRGAGASDKPARVYSTELFAADVSAFMQAMGSERAHVMGLSLGGAVGLWLAAKHPKKVKSLSVHSGWTKTDPFLKTVVEGWQVMAQALGSVTELVIQGIFPWCLTPELYANQPDYLKTLSEFVRSRPPQPLDAFMQHANAVVAHDVESQLSKITAPTLLTFGRYDMITSRFAAPMEANIPDTELIVFEKSSHTPIYEGTEEFNQKTLAFLMRHSGNVAIAGTPN